ncbi:MAG TPA: hypothetical protein DIC53_11120 [Synergistaceae bacterium]|jgi:hypothetical protein|nr:hypothetical protein [Synergistaceae bacterium]
MEPGEVLIEARSPYGTKGTRAGLLVFGLVLLIGAAWSATKGAPAGRYVPQSLIGLALLWCALWERKVLLTKQGILRTNRCLGRSRDELLPWSDVHHLALSVKGRDMTLLVDHGGIRGIKLPFDRSQEGQLRAVLAEIFPDAQMEVFSR